jgi:membrane-associated protease RseP (regulator of RpoE activity)
VTDTALSPPGVDGRHPENATALVRLGVVVLLGIALAAALHALAVLVVVVALVAMVMLHELGHFATAKWSGMKVTEYFFGFGPKLWSIRRGETEYGVKAIPAGGYVRIVGMTTIEEVDPTDEPRSYRQASFPARFAVGVAGSTMHFLIALALLLSMLVITGVPTATSSDAVSALSPISGTSPAAAAGIVPGDRLVGVNGHRASISAIVAVIEAHPGSAVEIEVARDGRTRTVTVRPITRAAGGIAARGTATGRQGFIGVELGGSRDVRSGILAAIPRAGRLFGTVVANSFTGIGQVFSASGLRSFAHQVASASSHQSTAKQNSGQLISIVGAVQIGSQAASQDPAELLYLLVAINVFVGIINLFPMLPLDGGHVVIACYERIRSRRGVRYHADIRKLMPVAYAFLAFIVAIGLGALYANVLHPVSLPGG